MQTPLLRLLPKIIFGGHTGVTGQNKNPQTLIFQGIAGFWQLLELDRPGRLARAVIEHAVDALDFVDDAARDLLQDSPRQGSAFGGHEVAREDGAERYGVVVCPAVAHDADAPHIRKRGEVLAERLVHASLGDLFAIDGVGLLDDLDLFRRDLADDADAKAWARERLAIDQMIGNAQLAPCFSHLVLEQETQRLDDLLEVDAVGQSADVVVALDDGGLAEAALDDVRIDRSLHEEVDLADLLRFGLEDTDELLADDLALLLRLGHALELFVEPLLGIDADEVQIVVPAGTEDGFDLIALVLSEEAVIDEDAGELLADRLRQEHRRHGGVDAARERAERLARADLLAQGFDRRADEGRHLPIALAERDAIDEVFEDLRAVLRVHDLGMELHGIELSRRVFHRRHRAVRRLCRDAEPRGRFGDIVGVAHPGDALLRHIGEEQGRLVRDRDLRPAVLADGRRLDLAAELVRHELRAVAYAEDGYAERKDLLAVRRGIRLVDALRAAREDDRLGRERADLLQGKRMRMHLAVNAAFAHAARDQLVVLTAEVQHDNQFMAILLQGKSSFNLLRLRPRQRRRQRRGRQRSRSRVDRDAAASSALRRSS